MEEKTIGDVLQRAERIVKDAGLEERLEPVAFGAVAELLLRAEGGEGLAAVGALRRVGRVQEGEAINEFLRRLNLKSHSDRAVTIAYYLLHSQGQLTFNVNHLEDAYTLAREVKPKNFADVAGACAKKGFFTATGHKLDGLKEWQITKTGEVYVEELMNGA
jgi:hypothetical protein